MLHYIWGGMIMIAVLFGAVNGKLGVIGAAAIEQAKEATNLTLILMGTMGVWLGFMKIAEASGLIQILTKKLKPFLHWLFPQIPKKHKSLDSIAMNLIANFLGLGSAATPFGLKAMEELQEINQNKDTASNSMIMFLVVNISSVQLLPINIIAYRVQFGSANPAEIIGPAILATIISTFVGIIMTKWYERSESK